MTNLRPKFFGETCWYGSNNAAFKAKQDDINTIYGLGSGSSGYYQGDIAYDTGGCVSKAKLLEMRTAIMDCAEHQGTTLSPAAPATSILDDPKPVDFHGFVSTLVSNTTQITTNKDTVDAASVTVSAPLSSVRTTTWATLVQHIFTVTAVDQDHMRGFFNAGGQIRFAASRTGGSATTQNTDWTTLLSNAGTTIFDTTDFFAVTTSYVSFANYIGTGVYAANDWDLAVMTNTVTDGTGRGGKGTVLTFRLQFRDDHVATGAGPDSVDGTLTSSIGMRNVDGTPLTIAAPTFATTTALSV